MGKMVFSVKTLILPGKRTFLQKKYYKCCFTVVKMFFISKNINFAYRKNIINAVLQLKRWFLIRKKQKFYLENEVFIYRKNFRNAVFQLKNMVFIRKNINFTWKNDVF